MKDLFYLAFENKYRGSRELIKSRLEVYLPFVKPLLKVYPNGKALDLGCGRGEWLELLGEQGFEALGVDIDDGMLHSCRELNLNVQTADALSYMQTFKKQSMCIVSGFHIAEHLPFQDLQNLVQEAFRLLLPGGLLILETPNPENITVGSNSFYIDPSHQRPLPPDLLRFLPEHYGFERSKVLRLQENPNLKDFKSPELIDVLKGVSPDYAIISQKTGSLKLMKSMDNIFNEEFGLSLDFIAGRFQADLVSKTDIKDQLNQALEAVHSAQAISAKLNEKADKAEARELERRLQLNQALEAVGFSTNLRTS